MIRIALAGGLIAVLLLAGCSAGPPVHYYSLAAFPEPGPALEAEARPRIGVATFRVDPPYDNGRLVYRSGPESPRVEFYAYHQWAAPLGHEVARSVVASLAPAFPEHVVETLVRGRGYEAIVRGRVLRLEEVDQPNRIQIRALMELELQASDGRPLWLGLVAGQDEAATATLDDVVRMMRRSIGSAARGAAADLARALSGLEAPAAQSE